MTARLSRSAKYQDLKSSQVSNEGDRERMFTMRSTRCSAVLAWCALCAGYQLPRVRVQRLQRPAASIDARITSLAMQVQAATTR